MPTHEAARRQILEHAAPLAAEVVPALSAVGRVLAADVRMPWALPQWESSAMDGFAVRSTDCAGPALLRVTGYVAAGAVATGSVGAGEAIKIMTGAPVPAGADAIVPIEEADDRGDMVQLRGPVKPGAHVRRRGEDLAADEVALSAGTVVGPGEVGLLATISRLDVAVVRRPRVAILSTGDELVEPGQPLGPGQIYDSNAPALAAAVLEAGAEPLLLGIARDDPADLRSRLERGLAADLLVTSAGVSMGDRDLVRATLEDLGVRQVFWKVDIKPGRPIAFAVRGAIPVFSLPGNPVSTLLTFEQFVRPALRRMLGHAHPFRPRLRAVLAAPLSRSAGRVRLVRVTLARREDGALVAASAGNQETGILKTLLRADAIAIVPDGTGRLEAGETVLVEVLRPGFEGEATGD